jgi:hypothetical protein
LILSGFANAPTAPKYYDLVELVVVTIWKSNDRRFSHSHGFSG